MGVTSSNFLVTGRPRKGGSMLTAEALLEHQERMLRIHATTVTVGGIEYSLEDFCQNPTAPYTVPCLKRGPPRRRPSAERGPNWTAPSPVG